jgi:predicted phosphodiesterase
MTVDEYKLAVKDVIKYITDSHTKSLVKEVEKILRFEIEHNIPEKERISTLLSKPVKAPKVRTAIISDIHGSYDGLLATLEDIENNKCKRIICLGDIVEGGPDNEKVINALIELKIPCIRGNHDEINDLKLSESSNTYLINLPERIEEEETLYIHISPRAINRMINHEIEAWNVFNESDFKLIFTGHVHVPFIFGEQCDLFGTAKRHVFEYNQPFSLQANDRYIISVGSIAYGRDQIGKIRYAIHDPLENTIEHRTVKGPVLEYDYSHRKK